MKDLGKIEEKWRYEMTTPVKLDMDQMQLVRVTETARQGMATDWGIRTSSARDLNDPS